MTLVFAEINISPPSLHSLHVYHWQVNNLQTLKTILKMKINPVTVNKKLCVLSNAQGVELVNSSCPRLKLRDLEMEMFDRVIMQLY